ncbi:MAG: TolC family protein [Mariprofundales bacterium]|nr:TolC family protein [Mariprofundales bacterium]
MILLRAKISLFANILILLFATPVAAQSALPPAMTLRDAVQAALQRNPTLAAASSSVDAASATSDAARGLRYPRLDLSTGAQRTDSPMGAFGSLLQQRRITTADFAPRRLNHPGYVTNYQSQAALSLPLYHGGVISAAQTQAHHQLQASEALRLAQQQQITAQVIASFIAIKEAQSQQRANTLATNAASQRLHDVEQLQQQGMALQSDIMDAQAHLLQSQLATIHSANALAHARDTLDQLTATPKVKILGKVELAAIKGSRTQWQTKALAQRQGLRALQYQRSALDETRAMARATFLPDIDLMAVQQWNSNTPGLKNRNTALGATISINLFAGGSDQAKLRVSEAKISVLDSDIAALRQSIKTEIADRWRGLKEAKMAQNIAAQIAQQRTEALRIRTLRHQQGLEKSSDLLRAQVANDQAQVAAIHARYGLLQAQSDLYLAAGALIPKVIQ